MSNEPSFSKCRYPGPEALTSDTKKSFSGANWPIFAERDFTSISGGRRRSLRLVIEDIQNAVHKLVFSLLDLVDPS